jgi:hypothetical protein
MGTRLAVSRKITIVSALLETGDLGAQVIEFMRLRLDGGYRHAEIPVDVNRGTIRINRGRARRLVVDNEPETTTLFGRSSLIAVAGQSNLPEVGVQLIALIRL